MNWTIQTRWIAFSERVYRALLILYPADYRRDYGDLMVQVFRDVARDRYHRQGWLGIALWWCATLLDLSLTVIEQRRKVKFTMSKSTLTQLTGILLIVGGFCGAIAAFSQLQPGSHYSYRGVYQLAMYMQLPHSLLIGIGSLGLALQYGKQVGQVGKWVLIVSGIGALIVTAGFILMTIQAPWWNVAMIGFLAHTGGMVVFGLLNLWAHILPVYRGLPMMMGVILLAMVSGILYTDAPWSRWGWFAALMAMGVIWIAIGVAAHRDQMQRVKAKLAPMSGG